MAVLIKHGAHATVLQAGQDNVALLQRALLDQQRRNGTATFIETRLDDDTRGGHISRRRQLQQLRLQQQRVE